MSCSFNRRNKFCSSLYLGAVAANIIRNNGKASCSIIFLFNKNVKINDTQLSLSSIRLQSAHHDKSNNIDLSAQRCATNRCVIDLCSQRLAIMRASQRSIASLNFNIYAPASESMCTRDVLISFVNDTLMSSVVYEIYFIFDEWPDILVVALKSDEKLTF